MATSESTGDIAADSQGQGEHVLVVDDEPDVAHLLERMLVARGYRVTTFTSSEEALAAFRREPGSYHAVITDQTMPRMTGIELARNIKLLRAALPIILTTGYGEKVGSAPVGSSVDAMAGKPLDANGIALALRRLLTRT